MRVVLDTVLILESMLVRCELHTNSGKYAGRSLGPYNVYFYHSSFTMSGSNVEFAHVLYSDLMTSYLSGDFNFSNYPPFLRVSDTSWLDDVLCPTVSFCREVRFHMTILCSYSHTLISSPCSNFSQMVHCQNILFWCCDIIAISSSRSPVWVLLLRYEHAKIAFFIILMRSSWLSRTFKLSMLIAALKSMTLAIWFPFHC
jgi:hypothetical protein